MCIQFERQSALLRKGTPRKTNVEEFERVWCAIFKRWRQFPAPLLHYWKSFDQKTLKKVNLKLPFNYGIIYFRMNDSFSGTLSKKIIILNLFKIRVMSRDGKNSLFFWRKGRIFLVCFPLNLVFLVAFLLKKSPLSLIFCLHHYWFFLMRGIFRKINQMSAKLSI